MQHWTGVLEGHQFLSSGLFRQCHDSNDGIKKDRRTTRFNNQLGTLVSSYKDPLAEEVDAMVCLWDQYTLINGFPSIKTYSSYVLEG